jgi:hypothetical protein
MSLGNSEKGGLISPALHHQALSGHNRIIGGALGTNLERACLDYFNPRE